MSNMKADIVNKGEPNAGETAVQTTQAPGAEPNAGETAVQTTQAPGAEPTAEETAVQTTQAPGAEPTAEETIEALEKEIEALKKENAELKAALENALSSVATLAQGSKLLLLEHEGKTYQMKTKAAVYQLETITFNDLSANPEKVAKLLADSKQDVLFPV